MQKQRLVLCRLKSTLSTPTVNALKELHDKAFEKKARFCPELDQVTKFFTEIQSKVVADYNRLLDFMILYQRPPNDYIQTLEQMESAKVEPDKETIFGVVKGLCLVNDLDKAEQILDIADHQSIGAYDLLIKSYFKRAIQAQYRRKSFLSRSIESMPLTDVEIMVQKDADVQKANSIAMKLVQQNRTDLQLIRSFVYGHSKLLDPLGCIRWIKYAPADENLTPLYNNLMDAYGRRGDDAAMIALLESMKQNNKPNSYTYASIMKCLANKKDYRLSDVISDMKSIGISPTIELYNVMLKQQAIRGRVERVDQLIEKLKEQKIPLDVNVHNNAILARCTRIGINLNRLKLWELIKRKPQSQQHNVLHKDIMNIFQDLPSQCLAPNSYTINHVLMSLLYQSKRNELQALFRQCLEKQQYKQQVARKDKHVLVNTTSYNIYMTSLLQSSQTRNQIRQLFQEMIQDKVEPDCTTLQMLLMDAHQTADVAQVEEVVAHMVSNRQKYGLYGSYIHDNSDLDKLLSAVRRRLFGRLGQVQLVDDIDWLRSGKITQNFHNSLQGSEEQHVTN